MSSFPFPFPPKPQTGPTWHVDPTKLANWWDNSGINNLFVKPLMNFGQYTGDVWAGRKSPMGEGGHATPEAIKTMADVAGMIPMSGAMARPVGEMLASGPSLAPWLEKTMVENAKLPPWTDNLYHHDTFIDSKFHKAAQNGWDAAKLAEQNTDPKILDTFYGKQPASAYANNSFFKDYVLPSSKQFAPEFQQLQVSLAGDAKKSADQILAPKPLDTEKYPWLAKPMTPEAVTGSTGILDRWSSLLPFIREEMYRQGVPTDTLMDVQRLEKAGQHSAALELSDKLRSLLPPDWAYSDERMSTVVPWAADITKPNYDARLASLKVPEEKIADAKRLGFDPANILYSARKFPTDQFFDPSLKGEEPGIFLGDNPSQLTSYGKYMYPVVTRAQNPLEVNMGGKHYAGSWMENLIRDAQAGGHDMLSIANMQDVGGKQNQYVVLDPALLRSVLAKFDPTRINENNLLATAPTGISPFPYLERKKKK